MTEDEKIARGDAAKRIVEDSIFLEAWEAVDRYFYEVWRDSAFNDVEGREAIKRTQIVAARFRDALTTIIFDGEQAKHAVESMLGDD